MIDILWLAFGMEVYKPFSRVRKIKSVSSCPADTRQQ